MELKGKGAGSQGYPPRGLGQSPNLSVAAKKGTSLAVEREPCVGLRSGLRGRRNREEADSFLSQAGLSSLLTSGVR